LHGEEPINDTDDGLHHSSNDYPQNISENTRAKTSNPQPIAELHLISLGPNVTVPIINPVSTELTDKQIQELRQLKHNNAVKQVINNCFSLPLKRGIIKDFKYSRNPNNKVQSISSVKPTNVKGLSSVSKNNPVIQRFASDKMPIFVNAIFNSSACSNTLDAEAQSFFPNNIVTLN